MNISKGETKNRRFMAASILCAALLATFAGSSYGGSANDLPAKTEYGITYAPSYSYAELPTGIKLAYVALGERTDPAVVFIHGATDSYISWSQIAPRVANAGYYAIVPELRGHGKTDKPEAGPYAVEAHAKDIGALLDFLDIGRAHFVGHSLGTFVSSQIAVERPSLVSSLTLIGGARTVDGNATAAWLLEGDGEFRGINHETVLSEDFLRDWTASTNYDPQFTEKTYEHAKSLPLYVWRNVFNGILKPVEGLEKITAPVQLIWGTADSFFTLDDQNALIEALSGTTATLIEKDGLSHNTHWEDHEDEDVTKDILSFIGK
jgi:pimeloyl-ACP methyl ester carboxylesterase